MEDTAWVRMPILITTDALQCCQSEPRLGDTYSGQLRAFDGRLPDITVQLAASASPLPAWDDAPEHGWPTRLDFGGTAAYYVSREPLSGQVSLPVILHDATHVDLHPDVPPVRGRVLRLRLVEEHFRWDESIDAFTNDLHDLSRFRLTDITCSPYRHLWWPKDFDEDSKEPFWEGTGVVADLEVLRETR